MKVPALLLLCAVTLTQSVDPLPRKDSRTCNCNPNEAWQICDANYDNDNILISHQFCDKFYKCTNGKPVAYNCPGGLLYDPYTEICDWPQNVECGDRPISEGDSVDDADCDDDAENEDVNIDNDSGDNNQADDNNNEDNGDGNEDCDDAGTGNGDGDNNGNGDSDNDENITVGGGNCDPSEAPTICATNDSEGVLVAHENCNKFYICNGGKPVAMKCPDDLLFNPNTDQCDWPHNVDCGDRIIPDPEDNDNGGNDNEGDDSGGDNGDGENGGSDNGDGDNNGSDNGGSDNDSSGSCNCNPGEALDICAADGSSGVLIAHENCNQFYKCAYGKPVALTCPGNLLYNPYTEQCDWPERVECGDRVIPDPDDDNNGSDNGDSDNGGSDNGGNENGDSDNGGNDNEPVGGGNCDPSEAPSICAANDSEDVLVAHENCNQFYICNGGKPVALKCPGDLLFNPNTDRCDWPQNVDCGDRIIPDPEDNESDGSDNGGSDNGNGDNEGGDNGGSDNGNNENEGGDGGNEGGDNGGTDNGGNDNEPVGGGNCDPSEAPSICAANDSESVLVAHENCNQFYICNGGKPVALKCPGNLLFNPNTDQCDWPQNVDCGDRIIPDPEDNESDGSDNGGSDNGNGDNGGGDNGGSDNEGVDGGNEGGDNGGTDNGGNDNEPVGGGNCDPSEAPSICAANDSESVLVAHENCNQFYICNGGKPVALKCPGNLLFNPNTDQCDWPQNVDCGDRIIPDPEDNESDGSDNGGGDNGGGDNGGSDNGGGDNGGSDNGGSGSCNCNPGEAQEICETNGSDGVLIAHEKCNQFYKCAYGKPIAFKCPANLLYNPYIEQCDWPENVECGDRVIPEPEDDNNGSDNGGSDNGGSDNGGSDNDGSDNGGSDNGGTDNGGSDNGGNENGDNDNKPVGGGNCDPSEAPSICAANDSEGVLVAHENCNQFYICNGGKPVTMSCPGVLLFNPTTDQCDWPENVDCGDRIIPDPEDNDNGGNDNEGGDSGGGDNGGGDNGDGDNGGSDNGDGDNNGSDNGGSDNDSSGSCNCNPGEALDICAADGSSGVLIAHENCNQFYKCAYGKPVALTCPGNLLYNPYTEQCDWPERVECGDRVIPDPEDDNNGSDNGGGDDGGSDNGGSDNGGNENGDSDNGGNDNKPVGGGNCDPSEAPSICAANDSEGVLVAHENCNQFYICNGGKPVTLSCPGVLLFNPTTDQCDWAENVDCGDRIIPDPEENDNNDNGDGDNGDSDNNGNENEDNGNDGDSDNDGDIDSDNGDGDNDGNDNGDSDNDSNDNGDVDNESGNGDNDDSDDTNETPTSCADSGSNGVLLPHENCNQYYMCNGGLPVAFTCAGDLLFNPLIQQCDWPRTVDCGDRVLPDSEGCLCNPRQAPAICSGEHSEGLHIAHESCNQFYVCAGGVPVARTCPGVLFYNPRKEVCDWPMHVDCDTRDVPFSSFNKHMDSRQTLRV